MQTMTLSPNLLLAEDIDSRWINSPFVNLKNMLPKQKGKRFEEIAHSVFEQRGMNVVSADNTDFDRYVDDVKIEIKGSMVTKGTDNGFSFLQIRPDQNYESLVFECFHFDGTIEYYWIEKNDIDTLISDKVFKKQHGGNKAESRTYIYNGTMDTFKEWFWFSVKIEN